MRSVIKVQVPEETKLRLERLAKAEGKSLNRFITERLLERTEPIEPPSKATRKKSPQ